MRLLHYSAEPFSFDPERQYPDRSPHIMKPRGLWVSVQGEDDWPAWCTGEGFQLANLSHVSEVILKPDANVLVISHGAGLDDFTSRFPNTNSPLAKGGFSVAHDVHAIDWPRVKATWDGLIIAPYQWHRRLELMWYYGWDCASGVIWNLAAIAGVKPI